MKKAEKENVRNLKNVPDFNPEEWGEYVDAGCYPYALDLKVNKFFLIGSFIGKVCVSNTSDEELIETLKEELETIFDYEVEEIEPEIKSPKGGKKIYLQRHNHTGYYHLFREDSDGIWSHKYPGELPNRKDSIGQIIENPDMMVDASFTGWCFLLKKKESV